MSALRLFAVLALVGCVVAAASGLAVEPAHHREARAASDFLKTLGSGSAGSALRAASDQSFNIGGVYQFDRQLLVKTVYKSSTIFTVHKEVLNYAAPTIIHCIQVVDLMRNGKNAAVTVQWGDIGQRSVSMKFKSQRGEKINYSVIIWGQ